jgi:hypothetical protein
MFDRCIVSIDSWIGHFACVLKEKIQQLWKLKQLLPS